MTALCGKKMWYHALQHLQQLCKHANRKYQSSCDQSHVFCCCCRRRRLLNRTLCSYVAACFFFWMLMLSRFSTVRSVCELSKILR